MATKAPCATYGHIHSASDVAAVGRFLPRPTGYAATTIQNAPIRATRDEAMRDACAARVAA